MRIQSIRVVNLLIFDIHLNIGIKLLQKVVYMGIERNQNIFVLLRRRRRFHFRFSFFFVLLSDFFGIVSFVTTNPDKFQFQSQIRLCNGKVYVSKLV